MILVVTVAIDAEC